MRYKQLWLDHWTNGLWWLFWNCTAMFGLWGAGIMIFSFLDNPPWLQLIDRGQFLLYSVGFLGQAMYILTKEQRITTVPYRRALISCTVLLFIVCAVLFAGNVLANFSESSGISARTTVLRYAGLSFLLCSIAIGFLVTLAAEERGDVDIAELGESGVRRLDELIPEGTVE